MIKKCKYCGKEFEPTGRNASRRKYCDGPHYAVCENCGNEFEIKSFDNGVPKCCCRKCTNELKITKSRRTIKDKYGVDNVSQNPEISMKISESISAKMPEIVEKRRQTMISKYGVEYPLQNDELRHKFRQTCLDMYGVDNPAKNSEVKQRIASSMMSEDCQSKYASTSLKHYGVPHPAMSDIVLDAMKRTCNDRYGHDFAIQNEDIKLKMVNSQRVLRESDPSISERFRQSIHRTCIDRYGVDWPCLLPQCREASNVIVSKINREFARRLKGIGILCDVEFRVENKSYDLHIRNSNILIEINPTYTHNSFGNHWDANGLYKNYHIEKTEVAARNGFRCIHVWDWDDIDKIVNMLQPKEVKYARKLNVVELKHDKVSKFLKDNHLQGDCKGQSMCLCLVDKDNNIVQVMTFGKPRYTSKYQYELLRLCTDSRYRVVGGSQRLFKYFVQNFHPESILSYCDMSKFSGEVYERLGMFHHHNTEPAKVWSNGSDRITDNLLRQRGVDQLFHTDFGKGSSNEELMLEMGWLPVYDCGQSVYVFRNKEID